MTTEIMPQQRAFTVEEFCAAYRVGRSRFYEMLREGEGPRVKRLGKRLIIPFTEAERWVNELPDREPAGVV